MNIQGFTYRILAALSLLMAVTACADQEVMENETTEGIELTGILPTVTRATVADLKDYVGKKEFDDKDSAIFVTFRRTSEPIEQFTYHDIAFFCTATTSTAGVTSIGWQRDENRGTGGGNLKPDHIYWTDATHEHTFTGYCVPQQGDGNEPFDWNKGTVNGKESFYGSIGDPTDDSALKDTIDFRSTFDDQERETLSGNVELRRNDILLSHSTTVKAEDAIANLKFRHGLAQVRVIVNISNFAAGGGDDTKSKVSDMVLRDMLTLYKWNQLGVSTEELVAADRSVLDALYPGAGTVPYDQRKSFYLWIPQPKGVGEKSSRTFTFYGMAVPTAITETRPLEFSFNVTYPDPMHPDQMKTHPYNASIKDIRFDSGKCTTISISLNHRNEKMTVGAYYDEWEFVDTPDQGELKKNATFLASTDRTKVTIIGDEKATVDDATWLYVNTEGKIKDIYGNDGSSAHPFQISTADQLLSFAYEVKGTNRMPVTFKDHSSQDSTLTIGFDFTGYYVALDAGLTLQATEKKTQEELLLQNPNIDQESSEFTNAPTTILSWIGVGETGKPFNGSFNGGVRLISRLFGSPFFAELGPKAHVEQLILENVIDIQGDGGFAEVNHGTICACKVDGKVTSHSESKPVGSFVGTNTGLIFACYHVGDLVANNAAVVGGLVGENTKASETSPIGKIVASYNYGKITATGTYKYGVLGSGTEESVYGCFYDHTKASNVSEVAPSEALSSTFPSSPKETIDMIRNSFVGATDSQSKDCLNGIINTWATSFSTYITTTQGADWVDHYKSHYYVSQPANYPYVY